MNTKVLANNKKVTTINAALQKELDALTTTSSKIRLLDSKQFTRGDIARILNIRYQHVRNVLITPVSKK